MPDNLCSNWVVMKLQTHHCADLRASGLSDKTIEELGFRSVDDDEAFGILGFSCGPALAFPYPGTDFIRLKPDTPLQLTGNDGKLRFAKYLSPRDAVNRLYIPPSVRQILDDPSEHLSITEGEKKAAKATQDGFPTVGIVGIWGFRDREHMLIPDLEDIVWYGRETFLVPDSDIVINPSVRDASWEFGWHLRMCGAISRMVVLNPNEQNKKVGLDDFLVAVGPEGFAAILAEAEELILWAASAISSGSASIRSMDFSWLASRLKSLDELEVLTSSSAVAKKIGLTKTRLVNLVRGTAPWRPKPPRADREKATIQRKIEEARIQASKGQIDAAALELANDPKILHKAIEMISDLGVAGEKRNIGIIRLSARSRALERPTNLQVHSPSSAGKTHVVNTTLRLEDASAYYELSASSERALIYLEEPLEHRVLYIQEPEGLNQGVGAAVIKSLIWEGRLKYDTVIKEDGNFVVRHVAKNGPTGLILTTTVDLDEQISNRLFRIELDTSKEQTRRIIDRIAQDAVGKADQRNLEVWHTLSLILCEAAKVSIPYAPWLAKNISIDTLRIRRDITQFMNFIRASAVEHRFQREQLPDGMLQATVADYAMVHALVADLFVAAQEEGVTAADREFLASIVECEKTLNRPPSQADLVRQMDVSKGAVSYRVNRLIGLGYLENHEERKGRSAKLVPGIPLPNPVTPLPEPCELSEYLASQGLASLIMPWVHPLNGDFHDCAEHLNFGPAIAPNRAAAAFSPQMNGPERVNSAVQPFTPVQSRYEQPVDGESPGVERDRSGVQPDEIAEQFQDEDVLEI